MVTVGLLTFIVLGLLAMFNQTQRAFRTSITQSDVLESGRATMELLVRELSQIAPSKFPALYYSTVRATNFLVEPARNSRVMLLGLPGTTVPPQMRTNVLQRFFFLSKLNQDWLGTAYEVLPEDGNGCVGALYRYPATSRDLPIDANGLFLYPLVSNRIAEGVVHLRLRAFAANGYPIVSSDLYSNAFYQISRTNTQFNGFGKVEDAAAYYSATYPEHTRACYFWNDAVPAYVEIELGILEPHILQRYRSIPIAATALEYLSNHVAQVHLFRQRVAIRNVDTSVYQ